MEFLLTSILAKMPPVSYEVLRSAVCVQRWWTREKVVNASLNSRTIKSCHTKLMTTGAVTDKKKPGRRPTVSTVENIEMVTQIFTNGQ